MTLQRTAEKTNGGEKAGTHAWPAVATATDPVSEKRTSFETLLEDLAGASGAHWGALSAPESRSPSPRNIVEVFTLIGANMAQIEQVRRRLAALEEAVKLGSIRVEYVTDIPATAEPQQAPVLFRSFYGISLVVTLTFGSFLFLGGVGVKVVHPLISAVGFLGGLGWLTTAVTDLHDWRVQLGRKGS